MTPTELVAVATLPFIFQVYRWWWQDQTRKDTERKEAP